MDNKTLKAITQRIASSSPEELRKKFQANPHLFADKTYEEWFLDVITEFINGDTSKTAIQKNGRKHSKKCDNIRQRLLTAKSIKVPGEIDNKLVNDWYYTDAEKSCCRFYAYPYFDFFTDSKKLKYLSLDVIDLFILQARATKYELDDFFSFYPRELASHPIFGANKSKRGERKSVVDFQNSRAVVQDIFTNENCVYYLIRSEGAHPLGPNHSIIYNSFLDQYLKNYLWDSNQKNGLKEDLVIYISSDDIADRLGMSNQSSERKVDIAGVVLSDLAFTTYGRMSTNKKYATGVIHLISNLEAISEKKDAKGSVIKRNYKLTFSFNKFVEQYLYVCLMRICNADIMSLPNFARVLVPFLQKERIDLYDHKETFKKYDLTIFKQYIRIPQHGTKAILEVIVPMLEEYKKQHIMINGYEVLEEDGFVMIDYIPLSDSERENILLQIDWEKKGSSK